MKMEGKVSQGQGLDPILNLVNTPDHVPTLDQNHDPGILCLF